jgi:hypothetical protein
MPKVERFGRAVNRGGARADTVERGLDGQTILAALSALAFAGVWAGLGAQVLKIARRGRQPPRFSRLLQSLHAGRFASWAWSGAAVLGADPTTGWLLLATRIPAVGLVAVTFLQRTTPRPPALQITGTVGAATAIVGAVAWAIALSVERWPETSPGIERVLTGLVFVCFGVQLLWALPQQILAARRQPLGNLRWFQMALAVSYGSMFLYAFVVRADWIQRIMIGIYGLAFLEQVLLVFLIERGVRSHRS